MDKGVLVINHVTTNSLVCACAHIKSIVLNKILKTYKRMGIQNFYRGTMNQVNLNRNMYREYKKISSGSSEVPTSQRREK